MNLRSSGEEENFEYEWYDVYYAVYHFAIAGKNAGRLAGSKVDFLAAMCIIPPYLLLWLFFPKMVCFIKTFAKKELTADKTLKRNYKRLVIHCIIVMGLQDRDYTRENYSNKKRHRNRRTDDGAGGISITLILIFVNVVLWLVNGFLFPVDSDRPNFLTEFLLLREADVANISSCYRFLTYGFAHSPADMMHILFNMFGLLMFGYGTMLGVGPGGFQFVRGENVECKLGRREFTVFYLLTILIGGIAFAVINFGEVKAGMLGASGGVCGVIILYAWMFPNKTLLLWGIVPMPMWTLGLLVVSMDAWGAAGGLGGGIAFSVHLAGAAFGTLYYLLFYKNGIELTGWLDSEPSPKELGEWRVHVPDDPATNSSKKSREEKSFNRRLDEVLKRYGEVGESGLTSEEREFLRRASQKFSDHYRDR